MIVYCFIKREGNLVRHAVATFRQASSVYYKGGHLALNMSVGMTAANVIVNHLDQNPEHFLFIVDEDRSGAELDLMSWLSIYDLNKYLDGITYAVEKYPDDFTPGSAASKIVENLERGLREEVCI